MSVVRAQRLATDLRRDLELQSRYFDLLELLREMDIRVCFEKPAGRAEAMSLDYRNEELIFVDPRLSERRRRFSLGHELGHLLLGHGATSCSTSDINGCPRNPQEQEANAFSVNLLLPAHLFRRDIRPVHLRADKLSALADRYQVSLTATAIRFAEFTSDPCAVIGVRPPKPPWITKGNCGDWWFALPPQDGTLVSEHLSRNNAPTSDETPARCWIEDFPWRDEYFLTEEVIQTSPSTWLVLLSEIPDSDDDPDLVDREAEEELERRRNRFSRY